MNTPASPADQSLLSSSSAGVIVALPSKSQVDSRGRQKLIGDLAAPRLLNATISCPEMGAVSGAPPKPKSWLRGDRIPAWLVSTIVHTTLILTLVLFQVHAAKQGVVSLLATFDTPNSEPVLLQHIAIEQEHLAMDSEESSEIASKISVNDFAATMPSEHFDPPLVAEESTRVEPADLSSSFSTVIDSASNAIQLPVGGIYRRDASSRRELGAKYGATPESEEAVDAALKWLAEHQQRDGSWSFDLSQEPCNGRCGNSHDSSGNEKPATAATGLALLAFLGAGHSQHEGIYADNVRRGLYFLRDVAKPTNFGFDLQSGSMYGHGIAMMALSEAMAMTRYLGKTDSDLFSLVNGGASFTMTAQHIKGGWRYVPGSPGDMTVTCWQVLSLISAQHGGVMLRTDTLARAEAYVRGLSKPEIYEFGYQSTDPRRTTTAVGLCMLLYLGQSPKPSHFRFALDRLAESGPKFTDVYHDYYATLALHHARHREWTAWHVPVREHLIKTQATEGHEVGSWHFKDTHGDVGGRLYTTAMSAMILEVYYRYLPLYQNRDEFKLD